MVRLLSLVLLAVVCASVRAQPDFDLWEQRMLAGDFIAAAEQATAVAEQHATTSVWAYRAGASWAKAGEIARAVEWLAASAERGYSGIRTIEFDSDIDAVRTDATFGAIIEKVRANGEERRAASRAAAEAEPVEFRFPPRYDGSEPVPLLIVLHGTGGTGDGMARKFRGAAAKHGAILVAPDGLRPSGRGFAWTFRDEAEWYVEYLIGKAREERAISEVVVAGFSQGANIALAMARTHPQLIDAVIPVCGHWEADAGPAPTAEGPRWALVMGARDPWAHTYDEARGVLTQAGADVELALIGGMGHAVPNTRVLTEALGWALRDD